MSYKKVALLVFSTLLFAINCREVHKEELKETTNIAVSHEAEKSAILQTLNDETKAAFQRDYEGWKEKWVHDPTISKTYINFADSSFTEAIGWQEISGFVKNFFKEHPEPEPLPALLDDIEVRLYGNGAWVTYEQKDSLRGLKRETRLMEKVDGTWKIASMQTTIYGFKREE
ncbi:nuclear transport factor 2 family protein [Flavobacteriaceae bacterium TP-CH-4]|uniref:Nuclear transport factor 2 family protein n=1 Tax=Pelagihabitans pacificus TaxID=2696054 RepID=A0A967ATB8_9FLAO|nr:nuclear transport factor 2 family protein [Pelagihabitans pacificus]NHF58603.1 nuclear transport factor 2 family protein [Pelagihabitans pacificus]